MNCLQCKGRGEDCETCQGTGNLLCMNCGDNPSREGSPYCSPQCQVEGDASRFQCPNCGALVFTGNGRTCPLCGYRGDWIQPGHMHLYVCPDWREDGRFEDHQGGRYCECKKLTKTGGLKVINGGKS